MAQIAFAFFATLFVLLYLATSMYPQSRSRCKRRPYHQGFPGPIARGIQALLDTRQRPPLLKHHVLPRSLLPISPRSFPGLSRWPLTYTHVLSRSEPQQAR